MKNTKVLMLSLLLSVAMPASFVLSMDEVPVVENPSFISQVVAGPVAVVGGVAGLVCSAAQAVLLSGSRVVEGTGIGLEWVGSVGCSIVTTAKEHRTVSGLVGLAAVIAFLKKTDLGRSLTDRFSKTISVLLGLDSVPSACPCDDHAKIVRYMR